jgi:hypothetical protein
MTCAISFRMAKAQMITTVVKQTLTFFNTIHSTLEWRVERCGKRWRPFATILRYTWERGVNGSKGETLVVTKLGADDACHVAYVSALNYSKAHAIAREIADTRARSFKRGEPAQVEP